ncbi:hypothetical protein HRG_008311 [Hirsutella rhossiliensis]|uniref:Uncharacterized protein n=1 Tax=Hirsutella rhossiliensis TaxID=111463 RepID=A0A9P8SFQ0_9HYPO|nr:uncharacterized protein HRG_08311 [Hirsutella rhossiliensis]KAH0961158.1 hypothetical protein HRG_08311 [Hirsutella rhossiliensis]
MDRGKKRKPMTWPKWNGQPESFHFYLDRLVFKYNTDEEEGLNGNNNVVWYEILQTLPDQMMRRVEGFGGKRARRATQTPEILLAPSPDVRQRAADREGAGQAAHLIQRDSQEFGKFLLNSRKH